jgi:hypothetical protein
MDTKSSSRAAADAYSRPFGAGFRCVPVGAPSANVSLLTPPC